MFGEGKYIFLRKRQQTEREQEENIWKRKMLPKRDDEQTNERTNNEVWKIEISNFVFRPLIHGYNRIKTHFQFLGTLYMVTTWLQNLPFWLSSHTMLVRRNLKAGWQDPMCPISLRRQTTLRWGKSSKYFETLTMRSV